MCCYCSITVAKYDETWVIRFVSKNYTYPWKGFANRLHLVLHADVCLFVQTWFDRYPNMTLAPLYTVVPSALHRGLAPLLLCMQSRSRVGRRTPRWDACMPPRCRNISSGWYLLATWQEIFSIRRDLDARFCCSYIDKIKRLLYVICCNQIVNKILHAWFV